MTGKPIDAEDIAVLLRLQAALPNVGLNGWFEGVRVLARVIGHLTAAQQQGQAVDLAPPSAPVGVEASYHPCTSVLIEGLKRLEGGSDVLAEWDRARAKADTALAQQPAAVDEAYPTPRNRAEAAALARLALAHLGVIDAHIDAAIARCETNSAAQRQEPTT